MANDQSLLWGGFLPGRHTNYRKGYNVDRDLYYFVLITRNCPTGYGKVMFSQLSVRPERSRWYLGVPRVARSGQGVSPRPGLGYTHGIGMQNEHLLCGGQYSSFVYAGGFLVARRATYVVDGRFFGHFFLEGGGDCAHTRESHTATIHSN